MKQPASATVWACVLLLTACGPVQPAPVATKTKSVDTSKPAAVNPNTASILGKMKEPVGLARQAATVTSLHDILPVSLASKGMGSLRAASSLISDNGGSILANNGGNIIANNGSGLIGERGNGVISNNGGLFGLLAATPSLLPDYVRVRQDAVLHQQPDGFLSAIISLYDVKKYDPHPGVDNEPALIDRFHMDVVDVKMLADNGVSFDLDLKVISSKRIPFVDKILLRETGHSAPEGGFVSTRMEYFVDFGVALLDGAKDTAALRLVAEQADLVPALDGSGMPGASFEAKRMDILGSNGHGDYKGEARFIAGGDIDCTCTHTRADGAETKGAITLHPDGSSMQTASSTNGKLALKQVTTADGSRTFEVRDLAQPGTPVLPVAVTFADGIASFDLGEAQPGRARIDRAP